MTSKKQAGVSLRTLARLAGVSVSTASRALHDHPVISAPVRKKIKELARKRGYQPKIRSGSEDCVKEVSVCWIVG